MRVFFILLGLLVLLDSCTNKTGVTSSTFNEVDGFLYYEKPETGSVVYAVFLPFSKKNVNLNLKNLDSNDYENGIKFSTANSIIKDRLYLEKSQKLILKAGINRQVYLLPRAKIYFHIEKSTFPEDTGMDESIQLDTLVYMDKKLKFKYRFGWITLDSIKVD